MPRIEKTVFVSYRRASGSWSALAISQNLTQHGYDVFLDYLGIQSGDFEQVIADNIKSRAHFLVLLTPSALERIDEPGDWLRREIETALEYRRNIVPLLLEGFDFATPSIGGRLTGKLALLRRYNGVSVPVEYFDDAMTRLRTQRLNVAVEAVLHPPSVLAQEAATEQRLAATAAPAVVAQELTAERWFEQGADAADAETKLARYTEAIRLKPDYAAAFFNRGVVRRARRDFAGADADYTEAIRLKPDDAEAFSNRADVRRAMGDLDGALADLDAALQARPTFAAALSNRAVVRLARRDIDGALDDATEAVRLNPVLAEALNTRGNACRARHDFDRALADFSEAIRLRPTYAEAFNNRGAVRWRTRDVSGALADYAEAIRLRPDDPHAHYNRALIRADQGDYAAAISDYQVYLATGAGDRNGDREDVERAIRELRAVLATQQGRTETA